MSTVNSLISKSETRSRTELHLSYSQRERLAHRRLPGERPRIALFVPLLLFKSTKEKSDVLATIATVLRDLARKLDFAADHTSCSATKTKSGADHDQRMSRLLGFAECRVSSMHPDDNVFNRTMYSTGRSNHRFFF